MVLPLGWGHGRCRLRSKLRECGGVKTPAQLLMSNIRIEFLPSEEGKPDLVEIRRVGDPNTVLYKVSEKLSGLQNTSPQNLMRIKKRRKTNSG